MVIKTGRLISVFRGRRNGAEESFHGTYLVTADFFQMSMTCTSSQLPSLVKNSSLKARRTKCSRFITLTAIKLMVGLFQKRRKEITSPSVTRAMRFRKAGMRTFAGTRMIILSRLFLLTRCGSARLECGLSLVQG